MSPLATILDRALADPAAEAALAADLDRLFGVTCAVLVVDMSGFTRATEEAGIAAALVEIRRLQHIGERAVELHNGRVVKAWADNLFCLLPRVIDAQRAAEAIVARHPSSAGIDYGRVLDLGDDLFGDAVNKASRLGEDVAKRGEVLLTDAAFASLMTFPPP